MSAADRGWGPGWPNCQRDKIVSIAVAGVSFPGGVRQEAAPIFKDFLIEYNLRVENLVRGWCWGFACRAIRGSTRPSNHSWGLAVDINAPRHPMGSSGTFSAAQAAECRRLAKKYNLRWGGDYSGRKDEMHFEYMGTRQDALKYSGNLTLEENEMLQNGDEGNAVKVFQEALMEWRDNALPVYGADSDFGDETEEWVRNYQAAAEIPVTGKIGGITAALLSRYVSMSDGGGSGHDHPNGTVSESEVRSMITGHASNPDAHHE